MEEKDKQSEKEYTAFGVTGGICTMIGLFIYLLLCKSGYILITFFHDFIENIKSLFGQ